MSGTRRYSDEEIRRSKEGLKAEAPLYHFEGAVKELEALCLRYDPESDDLPESDGWYAREILLAVTATREQLKRGHPYHAAAHALIVGSLAGRWPAARATLERQEANRRGGRAPKHLPALQAMVDRLAAERPKATARELWNLIPEDGFEVYRDGSKAFQQGRKRGISFSSFRRYVQRARSK